MQLLVKIVKDCESKGIFRTQQNIKMELFAEKVNSFQPFIIFVKSTILDEYYPEYVSGSVNYFRKELHLRCLTGFWIRLWYKVVFLFGQIDCLINELKFHFLLFWWNVFHSSLHVNYRFPKRPLYHIAQSIAHSVMSIFFLFCLHHCLLSFILLMNM